MTNNFIMLIGLPASGKSTFCEKMKNEEYVIHSSDALRLEKYGSLEGEYATADIFDELHSRIIDDLEKGKNIVYDATNIHKKYRIQFLEKIKALDVFKMAYVIDTPIKECIKRDLKRDRTVGEKVINKMYKRFQYPSEDEGFDYIFTFTRQ